MVASLLAGLRGHSLPVPDRLLGSAPKPTQSSPPKKPDHKAMSRPAAEQAPPQAYVRRYRRSSASSSSSSSSRPGRSAKSQKQSSVYPNPTFSRIQMHFCGGGTSLPASVDPCSNAAAPSPDHLVALFDLLVHESFCAIIQATMQPIGPSTPYWASAIAKYMQAHRLFVYVSDMLATANMRLPKFPNTRWHLLQFTACYFFRWLQPTNPNPTSGYCFRHRRRDCSPCADLVGSPALPSLATLSLPALGLHALVEAYLALHVAFFDIQGPRAILNESWTRLALYLMDFAVVEEVVCNRVDQGLAIAREFVPFETRFAAYPAIVARLTDEAKRAYVVAVKEQTGSETEVRARATSADTVRGGGPAGSLRLATVDVLMAYYRIETLDKNMETYIVSIAKKLPDPDLLMVNGDVGMVGRGGSG